MNTVYTCVSEFFLMDTQHSLQSVGLGLRIGSLCKTRIMTFYWKIWPQTHNHPYLILLGYISLFAHLYCPWQYCVLLTISIALYRSVSTGHHFDPASYYIYYHTHLASHAYIPQLAIYYFWILSYSFISKPVL